MTEQKIEVAEFPIASGNKRVIDEKKKENAREINDLYKFAPASNSHAHM